MKKIDLHIHTVATNLDPHFDVSLIKLKQYVKELDLDCIAITNHNCFDLDQFNEISSELGDACVLPGIEISLEGGHLLLISNLEDLEDFKKKCDEINLSINEDKKFINVNDLKKIFGDLKKYLLIPHHDKDPKIKKEALNSLKEYITAGEVSSPKKFIYAKKNSDDLVPVLFGDERFYNQMGDFKSRQTFINIEEVNFKNIKIALSDRQKVFLSKQKNDSFFQVLADGQELSSGLNLILGKRSSGKTFLLNKINNAYENIKYIEQFALMAKEEERDEADFKKGIENKRSNIAEEYLKEFKGVVDDIVQINRLENEANIERYINSLIQFASEKEIKDSFSNASLFAESLYDIPKNQTIKLLINSVENLINDNGERGIIDKYITVIQLKKLAIDLIEKYNSLEEEKLKKKFINNLIKNIQNELKSQTAATQIEPVSFYDFLMDNEKIKKFNQIVKFVKTPVTIQHDNIGKFNIVIENKKYKNATSIGNRIKRQISFKDAFEKYDNPTDFLDALKELSNLSSTEIYKCFVDVEYKILNEYGLEVSGGERSEFNLLEKIKDAYNYDMLLIDEPESSFDNIFLKDEINRQIKNISEKMPVVISTHNSTVGALIKPKYIIYTKRDINNDVPSFNIFSGVFTDKELKSINGETVNHYEVMLDCLEAGEKAYNNKKITYENTKN